MNHLKPQFFLIGERKCGTSSLFRYLLMHPQVLPGKVKEPQFFTKYPIAYIETHLDEYFSLFPPAQTEEETVLQWPELDKQGVLFEEKVIFKREKGLSYLTGDASANVFYELDPAILHRFFPDTKLILLLREPVARAYSHYRMLIRFQEEGRDLGRQIASFEAELAREMALFEKGLPTELIGPGVYINQLRRWRSLFAPEQFLIFFTEHMENVSSLTQIMRQIETFLELPPADYGQNLATQFNQAPLKALPHTAASPLRAFYQPYNDLLQTFLHQSLPVQWIYEKNLA